jgi:hypothetical protein
MATMSKKMTDRNPHTGEKLQSKPNSDAYRDGFDNIFAPKRLLPLHAVEEVYTLDAFKEAVSQGFIMFHDSCNWYANDKGYSPNHLVGPGSVEPGWATHVASFESPE